MNVRITLLSNVVYTILSLMYAGNKNDYYESIHNTFQRGV